MAVVAEELIADLRVRSDTLRAELTSARQVYDRTINDMGGRVARLERDFNRASTGIGNSIRSLAATLATAFSTSAIVGLLDTYTRFTNQLKVAGLEGAALGRVQDQLFAIAQRNGTSLETLSALYGRLSQSAKELGASQSDLIRFSSGVAAAVRVQGGGAAESAGAILQLTQALGGAVVRAEEFNSINEGARPILQAVANNIDRFGGSVAKLRAEVLEGKVTSEEFFQAFLRGADQLEAQAGKAALTTSAAFQVLGNALVVYFGEADKASGVSLALGAAIKSLAENLDTVIPALAVIGTAIGVGLVRNAIAATSAVRTLSVALGALGGPVGLAITAVITGLAYVVTRSDEAAESAKRLSDAQDTLATALADTSRYGKSAADNVSTVGSNASTAAVGVREFAGAVGDAARKLEQLAQARRTEAIASLRTQEIINRFKAQSEAQTAADARAASGAGDMLAVGVVLKPELKRVADASEKAAKGYQDLAKAAGDEASRLEKLPLTSFVSPTEVEGGRDVEGDLTRITRDLAIARKRGEQSQIDLLEAQKFEIDQYKKYRKEGQSVEAARDAASLDRRQFEEAARAKREEVEGRKGAAADAKAARAAAKEERDAAREAKELAQREYEQRQNALSLQQEVLQADLSLATTRTERLAIEQRLLALVEQEERNALEKAIADGEIADAAQARALLAKRQEGRQADTARQYESPLQRYAREVGDVGENINDSLEQIQVDGIRGLEDAIVGLIDSTESLGDAFKNVALGIIKDLIRVAIQAQVTGPLLAALGLAGGAGGGLFGGFGGGGGAGLGTFGRAGGGDVSAGRLYRVNEGASGRRVELFKPAVSGKVIPLGQAAMASRGEGARVYQTLNIDARNSVTPAGFAERILSLSNQQAQQAAQNMGRQVNAGMPARLAQFQSDGT